MVHREQPGKESDRRGKKNRAEIIHGINPVREAIKAGKRKIFSIHLLKRKSDFFKDVISSAEQNNIKVLYSDDRKIEKLSLSSMHQGIAAEVSPYQLQLLENILPEIEKKEDSLILILDGITDPMNFGSIIRSALLFNADLVITEEKNSTPVTATVCRASAGAVEHIKISRVTNLVKFTDELKKSGFWIYGADSAASCSMDKLNFPEKKAIILGSEGKGMRRLLKTVCDELFFIPTTGVIDSLNVSAAASAILSHLFLKKNDK